MPKGPGGRKRKAGGIGNAVRRMTRESIQRCKPALIATILFAVPASAQPDIQPGVRAAVQAPLHAAVILAFDKKNIQAAMARIGEAEAIPDKTPEETHMTSVVKRVIAEAAKDDLRPSQP